MNVFDYAMKVELDGKAAYEKAAAQTTDPGLKGILLEMAADEQKHYEVFKRLKANTSDFSMPPASGVLATARTYFEEVSKTGGLTFTGAQVDVWRSLLQAEQDAEKFYREKALATNDSAERLALEKIADEEAHHAFLIEGVVEYLSSPDEWMASGEWARFE